MFLTELFDKGVPGYQDLDSDGSQLDGYDLRKTRLTLKQINKMRQMNDVRNYEQKQKLKTIQAQYGGEAGGGGEEPF